MVSDNIDQQIICMHVQNKKAKLNYNDLQLMTFFLTLP